MDFLFFGLIFEVLKSKGGFYEKIKSHIFKPYDFSSF